jgi:type I restriction enzyme S subunit
MNMNWPQIKLAEVLNLDLDRIEVDPSQTYEMVGVYSFGRGLFHREPVQGSNTSYRSFYRLKADHIVMSQLFGWEGALALGSGEYAGRYVSPQFPTFLCNPERLYRPYFGWMLRRRSFWEELGTRTRGMGDRRRTLNPEALLSMTISLPLIPEQRRIVARIEELSVKIEEARTLRQHAAEQAQAFVAAEMHRLFLFDEAQTSVGDFARVQGGFAFPSGNYDATGTYQVVRIGNVRDGYLDLSRAPVWWNPAGDARILKYELKPRDLVISMTGTREKRDYGFIAKVPENSLLLLNQRVGRFVIHREIDHDYLFYFLRSPFFRDRLFPSATGTANQANVGNSDIEKIKFAPPPPPEQRRVVAYLDDLRSKVDTVKGLQGESEKELNALMPSILSRAFAGEL